MILIGSLQYLLHISIMHIQSCQSGLCRWDSVIFPKGDKHCFQLIVKDGSSPGISQSENKSGKQWEKCFAFLSLPALWNVFDNTVYCGSSYVNQRAKLIWIVRILEAMHIHTQACSVLTNGSVRVCFLQSREAVSVSLSFLPVSSSCLLLSHHCFCKSVCYMWLCLCVHCFSVCIKWTQNVLCKFIIFTINNAFCVFISLT